MAQMKMKKLNLYAGIGGNRKLWSDELEKIEYTFKNLDTLYEDLDSCDEEYEKTIHTHQLEGRRFCIEEIKQRIKEK